MTDRHPRPGRHTLAQAAMLALALCAGCSPRQAPSEKAEDGKPAAAEASEKAGGEGDGEGGEAGGRVTLSEAAFATARIQVEAARSESAGGTSGALEAPGQVDYDPARVAMVSPRAAGRIERLAAVVGDRVGAGQTVAYITSPAFLTAQNDLALASRRAGLLQGTEDAEGARALVAAARRRLELLGAGRGMIDRVSAGVAPSAVLPVAAPFAGTIVESAALAGTAVEPGTPIFKIADLSSVYVAADVPERALPSLRRGQTARVRLAAYPDFQATGHVERIADVVDPSTRTVKAAVRVANPERKLRPGMFATVSLDAGATAAPAAAQVTIAESAVVADGDARYVFVEVGPRTYERRAVETGPATAGRVAVRSGLAAGERVVVNGAFTLKSELGKAGLKDED